MLSTKILFRLFFKLFLGQWSLLFFLKQAISVSFLLNASSLDCGYIELKEDLYRLESAMLAAAFGMLGLVLKFWHTYKRAETKILGPENWFLLFGRYCVEVWEMRLELFLLIKPSQ